MANYYAVMVEGIGITPGTKNQCALLEELESVVVKEAVALKRKPEVELRINQLFSNNDAARMGSYYSSLATRHQSGAQTISLSFKAPCDRLAADGHFYRIYDLPEDLQRRFDDGIKEIVADIS